MATIPPFDRYRKQMKLIWENWDTMPNKVQALLKLRLATTFYIHTYKCKVKKEILGMCKVFHDLLKPEEKLVDARIEETESIISKVIQEMAKLHGIKEMLKDDTEISDVKKKEILKVIASINNDKDEEYQDLFGPIAFLILKQVPGIQDIVTANSEFPNDVKIWILEKLSLLQQPENKVEQPEQVPEKNQALYKSLIRNLVDPESKKFDLCKKKSEIHTVLRHAQGLLSSFESLVPESAPFPAPSPAPSRAPGSYLNPPPPPYRAIPPYPAPAPAPSRAPGSYLNPPPPPYRAIPPYPAPAPAPSRAPGSYLNPPPPPYRAIAPYPAPAPAPSRAPGSYLNPLPPPPPPYLTTPPYPAIAPYPAPAPYPAFAPCPAPAPCPALAPYPAPYPAHFCKNEKVEGVLFSPAAAAAAGKKRDRAEKAESESSTFMVKKSKYLSGGADLTGLPLYGMKKLI